MAIESLNPNTASQVQSQSTTVQTQDVARAIGLSEQQSAAQQSTKSVTEPSKAELDLAVEKLNDFTANVAKRDLKFTVDKDTSAFVVTVTDRETQEVIRQMPTEEALAVAKQIESMLGLILNDKA